MILYLCKSFLKNLIYLALLFAPAAIAENVWSQTGDLSEKAASSIFNEIAANRPQDVIVLFDDAPVRDEAALTRRNMGVSHDAQEILNLKASRYKDFKGKIFSDLPAGEHEVLKDYSHLPMAFLKIKSLSSLSALIEHPEVVRIYPVEAYSHFLLQSLPLINQPAVASLGMVGTGTTVAVLDTGVDYARSAFGYCTSPGTPSSCKVVYAHDFAPDDGALDDDGHGTNVAGIVLGVAPDTRIAALDVFKTDGYAYSSDIIDAINWSIANKNTYNIVSMNLSLGEGAYSSLCSTNVFAAPIANAKSAGILAAIAAGNDGYVNKLSEPACVPDAVSVGAVYDSNVGGIYYSNCSDPTTYADKVTCFSNSASFLTILAPGALITAAGYTMAGTSQATPHIAGAIAVLKGTGAFPSDTPYQTISRMTSTGVSVTDFKNGVTTPRIDLLAAVGNTATYSISGTVTSGGYPLSGVTITLTGGATETTNSSGYYIFSGLADGASYTVTPNKKGYTFLPTSITVNISGADQTGRNFAATYTGSYSISGRVTSGGYPLSGVTMTFTGGAKVTTDYYGRYKFTGLSNGAYTITPTMTGYAFTPGSLSVNINGANITGQNFTASRTISYSISGKVISGGYPLAGVTMTLTGGATVTTDYYGRYKFTGLSNGLYTITPSKAGYTFSPSSLSVTINGANVTGQSFKAY